MLIYLFNFKKDRQVILSSIPKFCCIKIQVSRAICSSNATETDALRSGFD